MTSSHTLFFALRPEPAAAQRIAALTGDLRRAHALTGRPVARDRLHLSLNGLGAHPKAPLQVIDKACEVASRLKARAFVVALDRVMSFQAAEPRPLVLTGGDGVIGVLHLYAELHAALATAGLVAKRERAIQPHVTLLRDPHGMTETLVDPISWRVETFFLIDSRFGEGRHEICGRWSLGTG